MPAGIWLTSLCVTLILAFSLYHGCGLLLLSALMLWPIISKCHCSCGVHQATGVSNGCTVVGICLSVGSEVASHLALATGCRFLHEEFILSLPFQVNCSACKCSLRLCFKPLGLGLMINSPWPVVLASPCSKNDSL